jgi:hypothetical protein
MNIREKLAKLEHQQWAHWTRYMLDNLTPENIERWLRQVDMPYDALSHEEKESDRRWADKVLEILERVENNCEDDNTERSNNRSTAD